MESIFSAISGRHEGVLNLRGLRSLDHRQLSALQTPRLLGGEIQPPQLALSGDEVKRRCARLERNLVRLDQLAEVSVEPRFV